MQTLIPRRHGSDFFVLALQLSGQAAWNRPDGGISCGTESLALINARTIVRAQQLGAAESLIVKIPRSLTQQHTSKIEDVCWTSTIACSGSAKIVRDFVLDLWTCSSELRGRDFELLPLTLLSLIECAFHGIRPPRAC